MTLGGFRDVAAGDGDGMCDPGRAVEVSEVRGQSVGGDEVSGGTDTTVRTALGEGDAVEAERQSFRFDFSHDWWDDQYWSGRQLYSKGEPCLLENAHTNPYGVLRDKEEEEEENEKNVASVAGVGGLDEVCLFPTIWRKWTTPRKEEGFFLGETVWKKWSRAVNVGYVSSAGIKSRASRSGWRTG
ncbi:unnamed protein product, partial [Pylaiella littoralis]